MGQLPITICMYPDKITTAVHTPPYGTRHGVVGLHTVEDSFTTYSTVVSISGAFVARDAFRTIMEPQIHETAPNYVVISGSLDLPPPTSSLAYALDYMPDIENSIGPLLQLSCIPLRPCRRHRLQSQPINMFTSKWSCITSTQTNYQSLLVGTFGQRAGLLLLCMYPTATQQPNDCCTRLADRTSK